MEQGAKFPQDLTAPPEAWLPARRIAQAMVRPIERFMHVEAASGIVLLVAAAVALIWANSPWAASYEHFWEMPVRIGVGSWSTEGSLHFWINDLLMTVFFLVVGLEIKRELAEGALSDVRRAALPVAAAFGGMLVPAAIYVALNASGPGERGWGVPMATDIAFAVGVITLLGRRIPAALRVLLLAFAIIDDIGAILVIAVFYSTGFDVQGFAIAGLGLVILLLFRRIGMREGVLFVIPLLLLWAGLLRAGVHPTIAGVIQGLTAPVRPWFGRAGFLQVAQEALVQFEQRAAEHRRDEELLEPLNKLAVAQREAVSPALRGQMALHSWVAYGVMPLFAFANAGVNLSGLDMAVPGAGAVLIGTAVALFLGKPLGVMLASWISVRLGLCSLPAGASWRGMTIVGFAAGIGFTMAIFIAELAFNQPTLLAVAKAGILLATAAAAAVALLAGWVLLPREQPAALAGISDSVAESSPELWLGVKQVPESGPAGARDLLD